MLAPLPPERSLLSIDRRSKSRYEISLAVRYSTIDRHSTRGEGHTLNLSSSGVQISSRNEFHPGQRIRISMEWPDLLDGKVPLQLIATGKVMRRDGFSFALAFEHHEFRTLRRKAGLAEDLAASGAVLAHAG